MATDLTFAQLDAALGGNVITLTGGALTINVNALTGDTYTAIDNTGVLELMYKLRTACGVAQESVNNVTTSGETLSAFPTVTFSNIVNGIVSVTQSQSFKLPLDNSTVIGRSVPIVNQTPEQ